MKDHSKFLVTKFIHYKYNPQLNESIDIDTFPDNIKEILKNEYSWFFSDQFDWNEKQEEYGEKFSQWLKDNENKGFIENLDILIQKTRADLITIRRQELAKKKLEYFEELILPTLGNSVLIEPLTQFMEDAILNITNVHDLEQAYRDAGNIMDSNGNIDTSKITKSTSGIFDDDTISLNNFEKFVKENPEYLGVFNDWKKLFDDDVKLMTKSLNAFRDSTSYDNIKALYQFLLKYRKDNI